MPSKIPDGWQQALLGDIISLEYGKALPEKSRIPGQCAVYGSSGIVGWHSQSLVKGPGIIVGRKGTIGSVVLSERDFWPIDTTYYVRQRDKSDLRWTYYLLAHLNLADLNESTGVPGLNRSNAERASILVPPISEQSRIAEILSSVDEAIRATQSLIKQTRKVKQGVLKRLLTKGIGHTRFKQTEIGEIPDCWRLGIVSDFFFLQRGFDITEKQSIPGDYPVISSSGFSYFHNAAAVQGPAVITGRKGKLGSVHYEMGPCWPHDTTLWVKEFKGNNPRFIYWFLLGMELESFDAATAVPTLNRNVVHAVKTAFPPLSEQADIARHLDGMQEFIDSQTMHLSTLKSMKSALMFDLLTGRKRVPTDDLIAAN